MAAPEQASARSKALDDYKKRLLQHKELDSKVRSLREDVKTAKQEYDKTEDDLKALQSVGQIIGEVLRQLDEERCEAPAARQQPLHPPERPEPSRAAPSPPACLPMPA
jgi:ATP-dependent 26S proteasome regulatory subunit